MPICQDGFDNLGYFRRYMMRRLGLTVALAALLTSGLNVAVKAADATDTTTTTTTTTAPKGTTAKTSHRHRAMCHRRAKSTAKVTPDASTKPAGDTSTEK
jgi:hypothetical protein